MAACEPKPFNHLNSGLIEIRWNGEKCYEVEWSNTWEKESVLLKVCKDLIQLFWESKVEKLKTTPRNQLSSQSSQNATNSLEQIDASIRKESSQQSANISALPLQYQNIAFAKSIREEFLIQQNNEKDVHDVINVSPNKKKSKVKKSLPRRKKFIEQMKSFKNGTRSKCDMCDETLSDKKSLARHKIVVHGKDSPFKCPVCKRMFLKPGDVRRHQASHSSVRPYSCTHCDLSYKTRCNLYRHMAIKHHIEACEKDNMILNGGIKSSLATSDRNNTVIEEHVMDISYDEEDDESDGSNVYENNPD